MRVPKFVAFCLIGLLWIGIIGKVYAQETKTETKQEQPAVVAPLPVWKASDFRMVPVRVHLLRAPDTAAGTVLQATDIERIFKKANGIWHAAGVHLWVESIVSEMPASIEGHREDKELPLDALLPLRPKESNSADCFNVYYIHAMSPNGIYMNRDALFVKETAKLKEVPGGIDEPLPRVSAHELGHGMGLPHRQNTTNLMASGTTGTSLNAAEIEIVRTTLVRFPWVLAPDEFLKAADKQAKAGNNEAARTAYEALLELPTPSSVSKQATDGIKRLDRQKKTK